MSGLVSAGVWVATGCTVSLAVACVTAFGPVIRAAVGLAGVGASVAASVFTLAAGVAGAAGAGVAGAAGAAAPVAVLLLLVTVAPATVVDVAESGPPATLDGAAVAWAVVVVGV